MTGTNATETKKRRCTANASSPIGCLLTSHHIVTDAGDLTLLHPTTKPDEGSLELTEEIMRARAYRFFEERGYEHGHDLEDWVRAEAEVFGKKPAVAELAEIVGGIRADVA